MTSQLRTSQAWLALETQAPQARNLNIASLLQAEAGRTDRMMLPLGDAIFDFSKHLADAKILQLLEAFATQQDVAGNFARMFVGDVMNKTENRAVLHTALRSSNPPAVVADCLARMKILADTVRADASIKHIIHIGIGGSDLGPRLVCNALAGMHEGPQMHFVANVDPDDLDPLLMSLDPADVLVTVASKTFTTHETMLNLKAVRMWMRDRDDRIIALTANTQAAIDMGIAPARILPLWDWVGGRYSVWSAIGLPIALAFGFDVFSDFLRGAEMADAHVSTTPYARNVPVLMALLEIWYRNFLKCPAQAVVPYAQRLADLPSYLQQLAMESNGKRVDTDGSAVDYETAGVVFGQVGNSAQHAFFQMLHQGTDIIPCDFIAAVTPWGCPARHKVLVTNMLAQSRALMLGKAGTPAQICPGNRPSTTILLPRLDAYNLGLLLAVYEHKTAALGWLWNINSFDQFGVELGKALTKELLALKGDLEQNELLDLSTSKLIFHTFTPEYEDIPENNTANERKQTPPS